MTQPTSVQQRHEEFTIGYYGRNPYGQGWVRCGYGDAAGMCDAIATDILAAAPKRNGPKRREAAAKAAALKLAGDAIWGMREGIGG